MKVPLSWLAEFFSEALDWREVAERLTLAGIEVEQVQAVGATDPLVVVGEITRREPVDKVPGLYELAVQADRSRSIVSNAPGLRTGQRIAVALPGATLFSAPELGLLKVEESWIHGHLSEAVVVHARNLGLGPDQEHPIDLGSAMPGDPVLQAWPGKSTQAADRVLWLAILPNIARCQAMLGVAREVAALLGLALLEPPPPPEFRAPERLLPSIAAKDACSVLSVTLLEKVSVTESPEWLRRRLVLAGMTPINNVVDASNYVMLELGQPTHPYDADRLPSLDLAVRRARPGERLLTLQQMDSEAPISLDEGAPLIVSQDVPVALAGVLGGRSSAISPTTRRVLLEAANFDWVAIRKSQRLARVYSEASARFSRGVNPELPVRAAQRFVELLRESSPELTVQGFGQASEGLPGERQIQLSLSELSSSLGGEISLQDAAESLMRGGLSVQTDPVQGKLTVRAGNARPDIALACDLLEEIARIRGYDRIPETMPIEPVAERRHDDHRAREALRDDLVRAGLDEIISYSLSGPDVESRLYAGHPNAVPRPTTAVLNPVSPERSLLRTSLVPALLQTVALNLRHSSGCRMFELGTVFAPGEDAQTVPREREHAAIVLAGKAHPPTLHEKEPRSADFFDLKGVLLYLLDGAGIANATEFEAVDQPPYRPGAAARILVRGRPVGTLGAVHPSVLRAFDLDRHSAVVLELWIEALHAERPERRTYREYDRQPSIELDIAMLLERAISASQVRGVVIDSAGPLLREVEAFDQFISDQFGEHQKALAIRLRLNAGERTLEMAEALEIRTRVARALQSSLGAEIRE